MQKKILVTGASGGFGMLITRTLMDRGHTLVATMRGTVYRNQSNAKALKALGAHVVDMDITDDDSVNNGVAAGIDRAGGVDVVINNAGVGVLGLQECFTPEDWQRIFDVNVFGVQRVNRAVLPHMRAQSSGLIVYITSLLGRFTIPFYGPYNASKWAMEALAENYRTELSGFGIDACVVEPGGFSTAFHENLVTPGDGSRTSDFGDFAQAPQAAFAKFQEALAGNPSQNPQMVADAVAALVDTPAGQRPFRTVVDNMGMGEPIRAYNQQLDQVTRGIYEAFGMGDMLKLKV